MFGNLPLCSGKRAETVRQRLEEVFEQAVWRQPSVVLLDDLDLVTAAASSPEHEQGPEALLHLHIAQSMTSFLTTLITQNTLYIYMVEENLQKLYIHIYFFFKASKDFDPLYGKAAAYLNRSLYSFSCVWRWTGF